MIYTVTELDTGRVVGASVDSWCQAIMDGYWAEKIPSDVYDAMLSARPQHADGFALHGFKLGIRE